MSVPSSDLPNSSVQWSYNLWSPGNSCFTFWKIFLSSQVIFIAVFPCTYLFVSKVMFAVLSFATVFKIVPFRFHWACNGMVGHMLPLMRKIEEQQNLVGCRNIWNLCLLILLFSATVQFLARFLFVLSLEFVKVLAMLLLWPWPVRDDYELVIFWLVIHQSWLSQYICDSASYPHLAPSVVFSRGGINCNRAYTDVAISLLLHMYSYTDTVST